MGLLFNAPLSWPELVPLSPKRRGPGRRLVALDWLATHQHQPGGGGRKLVLGPHIDRSHSWLKRPAQEANLSAAIKLRLVDYCAPFVLPQWPRRKC